VLGKEVRWPAKWQALLDKAEMDLGSAPVL
jgi:hypothetical protein